MTKSSPFGSLDTPFNPISLVLGAEASFVARTHDMDRAHMMDTMRRAYEHKGSAFVEVYQNCNVFNDGAFEAVTAKDARSEMLINLKHKEPIRFGSSQEHGVVLNAFGECEIAEVADVGVENLIVHDETRTDPTLAFALSRLADGPTSPTPVGVFRSIERPTCEDEVSLQLAVATDLAGPGDLEALLASGGTWVVD